MEEQDCGWTGNPPPATIAACLSSRQEGERSPIYRPRSRPGGAMGGRDF